MGCRGEPFITVGQNGRWYFNNPSRNDISLSEVVSSLSQLARFNGHARTVDGHVYSVAQHCIKVSYLTESRTGLMHDAHECIIGDVSTPQKQFYQNIGFDFRALIDHPAAQRFAEMFGTSWPLPDDVKRADAIMCLIEAHYLLPNGGKDIWLGPQHEELAEESYNLALTYPELQPDAWTPQETADLFIDRYWRLK